MQLSPVQRATIRVWSRLNALVYRASGGRLMDRMGAAPVLLLTTRGRRSGAARTAPLLYLADGETYVVVASYGGSDAHPAWYLNLRDAPDATIRLGRREVRVRARDAAGAERERLWAGVVAIWPAYETYASKTSREIPLVVLEPVDRPVSPAG
ncbi:MAG: nitroreductase family deazaflavin-dependent oxidoreductase [Thermoleophilia bacterium]